jgi:hypothetical protein
MDELTRQMMRRGFADFGSELDRGAVTDDVVADWMTYPRIVSDPGAITSG